MKHKQISKMEMPNVEYIEDLCQIILPLFPASQLPYNAKIQKSENFQK